jgi:threonine synthase
VAGAARPALSAPRRPGRVALSPGGQPGEAELAALLEEAYAGFGHPAVAPLLQLDTRVFALELFHGPTLAFKDMAMQGLGAVRHHAGAAGERVTIVGATSGDTGSAAIEACRDRARSTSSSSTRKGRTSEVQRRQMTTVPSPNSREPRHRGDPSTTARTW